MFSQDVLKRLSQLNQQRRSGVAPTEDLRAAEGQSDRPATTLHLNDAAEEDVSQLPAGDEVTNAWGTHWHRARPLAEIWPHGELWLSERLVRRDQSGPLAVLRTRELRALHASLPNHVVYLDLETCGFSGSMIFLIGLIHRQDGQLVLSQLLARNYAEEKSMLQTLWSTVAHQRVLATFNGKSFDWPMVHDRSTLHHLGYNTLSRVGGKAIQQHQARHSPALTRDDPRPELIHCDLLHHARRKWKSKLPDCKLQTLERYVCRRHRGDDIPGREIPPAYHDFVRSGDAWLIRSVLHHNALDLVTLLQLSMLIMAE